MRRPARAAKGGESVDTLVARGNEQLAAGRFKEAAETFRQLVKIEPRADWRHALARAYVGRARGLVAKGMVKEAAVVLDNAAAADGVLHEPLLHLACLVQAGDAAGAAKRCGLILEQGVGDDVERERVADLAAVLWLTGSPPPQPEYIPGGGSAHAAAAKALAAWQAGRPAADIDPLINAISLRSPFKALRSILKAAIEADDGRRNRLLGLVPAHSAFAGLAEAVRATTGPTTTGSELGTLMADWSRLSPATRTFATERSGQPAETVRLLNTLNDAEQRGPAALLDALLKHRARFADADLQAAILNLLPQIPDRLAQVERQLGPLDDAGRHRLLALAAERDYDWDAYLSHWLAYIRAMEDSPDPDAGLIRSVVYRHLADEAQAILARSGRRPEADPRVTIWLTRSVEAAPDDRDAVLTLIGHLRRTGQDKERHGWADRAAARFPNDAAVLLEALEAVAERGAYRKAADLAETLLGIDPINIVARQRLVEFGIAHARKKVVEGRTDLAEKALAEAIRRAADDGVLTLVRGLVALRGGRAEESRVLLQRGTERLGNGVAAWWRVLLEARTMRLPDSDLKALRRHLDAAMKPPPRPDDIVAAVALLNHRDLRGAVTRSPDGLPAIERWLHHGAPRPLSKAEFQAVAGTLEDHGRFALLSAYAQMAQHRAPDEPLYEVYAIIARAAGKPFLITRADLDRLEHLARRAEEAQDRGLSFRIVQLIDKATGGGLLDALGGIGDPYDEDDPDLVDEEQDLFDELGEAIIELLERYPPDKVVDLLIKQYGDNPILSSGPKPAVRALLMMMVQEIAKDMGLAGHGGRKTGRRRR